MEKDMSEWKEKEGEMKEKLLSCVYEALKITYKNDYNLIEREVHERSIVFRFGIYFQNILLNKCPELSEYNLDFDYNRNQAGKKKTDNSEGGTYPDIIIHKRYPQTQDNILVIEFKTWWNKNDNGGRDLEKDYIKLKDFTDPKQYNYSLGLSIIIEKDCPSIKVFVDGIEATESFNS